MAAVRGPTGTLVAALDTGEFDKLAGSGVHDVDVVIVVGSTPTESQQLAIGRPRRVDDVAFVGEVQFRLAGAVGIHKVELRSAGAIADESDGLAGFRIPTGRHASAVGDGQALGAAAVDVGDEKLGIALHGRRKNDLRAVGGPGGSDIGAAEAREGDELAGVQRKHADLRAGEAGGWSETGESDARSIGRPAGSERNGFQGSELALVGAIVIHNPDFLGAAAGADESDLRGSDAWEAAGEFADDFVGELMGEFADLKIRGSAAINFSDYGLRRGIADVVKPGFDGYFGRGFGEIAEAKEIGVCGGIDPDGGFHLGGDAGGLGRIEAGAGKLNYAAELEVIAHDLSEKGSVRFRRIGARREVRDGEAGFIGIHADGCTKPILRGGGFSTETENNQDQERTKASELCLHPNLRQYGKFQEPQLTSLAYGRGIEIQSGDDISARIVGRQIGHRSRAQHRAQGRIVIGSIAAGFGDVRILE